MSVAENQQLGQWGGQDKRDIVQAMVQYLKQVFNLC